MTPQEMYIYLLLHALLGNSYVLMDPNIISLLIPHAQQTCRLIRSLRWLKRRHQHLRETPQPFDSSYLLRQQRHLYHVELIV